MTSPAPSAARSSPWPGCSVLPDPERPTVAPWNEGHMNLAWLTAEVER